MFKLDKNFKCPKSLKRLLSGMPLAVRKGFYEAEATYVAMKRQSLKSKTRQADE